MMKLVVAALALALSCVDARGASAQETLVRPKLNVRAAGRRITITERGRPHRLDLTGKVDAAKIEDTSIMFLTRKGGFVYLLLDVCGPSKVRPDERQCGAGDECNLVWLKLDARWRKLDAQSELYESCWLPVTSGEGPRIEGRSLVLTLDNLREWVRKDVGYDADRPEEGMTFKSSAIPKNDD